MQSDGVTSSTGIIGAVVAGFFGVANGSNFYVPKPSFFPLTVPAEANSSNSPLFRFDLEIFQDIEADYSAFNCRANEPIALNGIDVSIIKDIGIEPVLTGTYLIDADTE